MLRAVAGEEPREGAGDVRDTPRPRVAVAFIGTGRYFEFLESFIAACEACLFPGCDLEYLIFSDRVESGAKGKFHYFKVSHLPWPYVTLRRFSILLTAEEAIRAADWFLFLDADTKPVTRISLGEIFDEERPLTGVRHPYIADPASFPLERDPRSRACVPKGRQGETYWQGCLWGGRSDHAWSLMQELAAAVAEDEAGRVMAVWHDESHLNRYFNDRAKSVKTLDPAFAFPEGDLSLSYAPRILHVRKDDLTFGNTGAGRAVPACFLPVYLLVVRAIGKARRVVGKATPR